MTELFPTPLDLAHADLERIDRTIADLQKEREGVDAFIRMYGKYVRPIPPEPRKRIRETPIALAALPMSTRIANFMAGYLSERDHPVELPDFYPALEENGLIPGGSNPKQAVSAILGKDKRFTFVPKEGWKLAPTVAPPPGPTGVGAVDLS